MVSNLYHKHAWSVVADWVAEENLKSLISKSLKTRQPAISKLVGQYNGLCRSMKRIIQSGGAPPNSSAPFELKTEGLFRLDVDNDIWQSVGFDNIDAANTPRWLSDEDVREGIRLQLEIDRCNEEMERLKWERCALQEWFMAEWQGLDRAKSSSKC